MPTHQQFGMYLVTSREHFETLARYTPNVEDFYQIVAPMLPPDWDIRRGSDVWFYCRPPSSTLPQQGWKIHLSINPMAGQELLRATVPLLVDASTAFKFALDREILFMMNGKNWPREGAAKFMTVYPRDEQAFLELVERLHAQTIGMEGAHVLSDRRYKDSRVVYYRYGGIKPPSVTTAAGQRIGCLVAPDGRLVPDARRAYFAPPDWVHDPVEGADAESSNASSTTVAEVSLNEGAFLVEKALVFKNPGGVYAAREVANNRRVVLKEARPHIVLETDGTSAIDVLKKEYRILTELEDSGFTPRPVALFQDWEHWFFAEEFVDGMSLAQYTAAKCPFTTHSPRREDIQQFMDAFQTVFRQIVNHLEILHGRGIAVMDLSLSNIIVDDGLRVSLIDFEAACQIGIDRPLRIWTAGFAPQSRFRSSWQPSFEEDLFALGGLMLSFLFRVNHMLTLNPPIGERFLRTLTDEYGLPPSLLPVIRSLMDEDGSRRPSLPAVRAILDELPSVSESPTRHHRETAVRSSNYRAVTQAAVNYILSVADVSRDDRLFPADPRVFDTNPLSVSYGACGVAYAIHRVSSVVPDAIMKWILDRPIDPRVYPPGLYVGLAGIAWALDELGHRERAEELLGGTLNDTRLSESAHLFWGLAGWGLAQLRFFVATGNEVYLANATHAGDRLLSGVSRDPENGGLFWLGEGPDQLGLAHGSAGVALFLLYLYLATRDERYLECGIQALARDLAYGLERDGGASWPRFRGKTHVVYPYLRYGTAGVGSVVLRYYVALGEPSYKRLLDRMVTDAEQKYSVHCGLLTGLAGVGQFLNDMYSLLGDHHCRKAAWRLAEGIELFQVTRSTGVAFPGEGGARITCDYGTGSAGVLVFLDRLLNPETKAPFLIDELLSGSLVGEAVRHRDGVANVRTA